MFDTFGEAARLYARNYKVVQAVKAEFDRDVNGFLDAVREEVNSSTSGRLKEKITPVYRYWWLGEDDTKDKYPQFWLESGKPDLVDPGELKLNAIAPQASSEQIAACREVGQRPEFKQMYKKGGQLFSLIVRYGHEEPIQLVAGVVASVLTALEEQYRKAAKLAASAG
jgi:hypothetical protein